MEVVNRPGWIDEVQMHHLDPVQFLAAAQSAVAQLRWFLLGVNSNVIVFQTPDSYTSQGDIFTITLSGDNAVLQSVPVNEYYWDEEQGRGNIAAFKQVLKETAEAQHKANRSLHPMHREKYGALIPSKSYLITPIIVYCNALVFAVMLLAGVSLLEPTAKSLFQWGGNLRPAILHGDWWRLLTYMFLHSGGMHLLMNTIALLYIGMFLEPLLGKFRFAAAYLLTGVCAGLLSIAMHPFSVGVGASGAIFGLYGVFFSMLTTRHIQKTMKKTMLRSILFFIVFNLFAGIQGNIDNAAHIGGLVSGIVIGYVYYPGIAAHAPFKKQLLVTALITASVIAASIITLQYLKAI
ncbi:MAG: rhomboid family intramembrane serine protease [Flavipsychrobacter sp.]|nr:rhomboid family intramembrane serine protease [Flavipsychrobacter sp.]